MPPCNWPQKFSFCHRICPVEIAVQLHSHVADGEVKGAGIAFALLWLRFRKIVQAIAL